MPQVLTPNEQWLSARLATLDTTMKALAGGRTQYAIDPAGTCRAIYGNLQYDQAGNSTGLGNVWGIAVFNGSIWIQITGAGGGGGGSSTLAGDTDVTISAPANRQALVYNGTKWANAAIANSFNGRTGVVVPTSGDYTAAQVGALPSTDDLSAIATLNATAASVAMNSQKITGLANGTAASDAAAFGQIPASLPPSGTAGGDLAGTYPNPTVKASVGLTGAPTAPTAAGGTNTTQLASTAFVQAALPTSLPPTGAAGGDLNGSYPNPRISYRREFLLMGA